MFLAVQNGFDGVVDAAEVRGLDLDHVARVVVGEVLDVFEGVAPLVGDQLHVDAAAVDLFGQALQRQHLGLSVDVAVHGSFDAQVERLRGLRQLFEVIGHGLVVIVAERGADGAVYVDVEDGVVILVGSVVQDPVSQPCDVLLEQFALGTELGLDVVDQSVGQDLRLLDDHLVGVVVAVVAGLGEDVDGLVGNFAAVFFSHDFAHHHVLCLGDGVQDGLGYAVTDGGVQSLAFDLDGFHLSGQLAEAVGFSAHEHGLDVLVDDGDEVLGQEQRVSAACAGVLDGCAVAERDLSVFEDDLHGDGFAGHTYGSETFGHRSALIEHAVVSGALLDGALVVEVKACAALGANYV